MDGWTDRCAECLVVAIEREMQSATGSMIARAMEIDTDIECGIQPDLNEIPARVFAIVKLIRIEKSRYEHERMEESKTHVGKR